MKAVSVKQWRQIKQSKRKRRGRRMDSCRNGYVPMEVHIDKLRDSVERERLEVQEDGIRSKRRREKGSGLQIKG